MKESMEIKVNEMVRSKVPTLFVRTRIIRKVDISFASPDMEERKKAIIASWAEATEEQLESHPLIVAYRELQKQLSGDLKMLPAVEGLLTRGILKGRFPNVNAVVDAANIVSLKHLVPIGLFDADTIAGDIELALAVSGDRFVPIGKEKPVKLTPGTPILKDVAGVFSAVGVRDSKRTMITGSTRNVLTFSWGIEGVDPVLVSEVLDECVEEMLNSPR